MEDPSLVISVAEEKSPHLHPDQVQSEQLQDAPTQNREIAIEAEENHVEKNDNGSRVTDKQPIISGLLYGVIDPIPFGVALVNAIQLAFYAIGSILSISLLTYKLICAEGHPEVLVRIISTSLFFCGVTTFIQVTFGLRLPITQGSAQAFLIPVIYMMQTDRWRCPAPGDPGFSASGNETSGEDEPWNLRMREISGCLTIASVVHIFLGISGLAGILMTYIGPLTVAPLLCTLGLYLAGAVMGLSSPQWGISLLAVFLMTIFTVVLAKVQIPCPTWYRKRGCHLVKIQVFRIFSTMFALGICWILCLIFTITDVFPDDPTHSAYKVRTDAKLDALSRAPWLFAPYPGQWGPMTFSISTTIGMLAATLASFIESLGDYNVTAFVSKVPRPPKHAINRAVLMEGIGSILSGAFGVGHAQTSFSSVIGYIGFTGVASRLAWQLMGIIFIITGIIGKVGGILALVPDPIAGGLLLVAAGMVFSSGIGSLKTVDLEIPRNLMTLGISMMVGAALPIYIKANSDAFAFDDTGVLQVIISNGPLLGGVTGFLLDNILPGSREQRGFPKSTSVSTESVDTKSANISENGNFAQNDYRHGYEVYEFNYPCCKTVKWPSFLKFIPICPLYKWSIFTEVYRRIRNSRKASIND